jgi:glycosyltransferase involved in cell wall biosynthesis
VRELRRARGRHDVLHVHGLWRFGSAAAAFVGAREGIPLILAPCGGLSHETFGRRRGRKWVYLQLVERHVLRAARFVHFTTAGEYEASRAVFPIDRPLIIPPPVSLPPLPDRDAARRELDVPAGATLVVSIGRLDPIKGHELLVQALGRLHDGVVLALVGPDAGGRESALRQQAQELGVASRLRFTGLIGRADVGRWFAAADVFVSASEHENFGMAIAEAALAGLPVVMSRELPIGDDLGPDCIRVQREAAAFARAITDSTGGDRRGEIGASLRRRAATLWSPEAIGRRLREAYETAAGVR